MSYITTRMTASHHDAVLRLWKENMAALQTSDVLTERFRWFYQENPAGAVETVVALQGPDAAVVGCASAFPRTIKVGGDELKAGVPVDFAVSRAHRTGAAALGIQRGLLAESASAFDFFCGFPNKAALPVLQRVGYRKFATSRAWIKPLTATYKLAQYVKPRFALRAAAVVPNLWLTAADAWRLPRGPRVSVEFTGRADERFDLLWARARNNYAVAGERSSAYLNWRYTGFRTLKYSFFCVSRMGSTDLLGYIAFYRRGNKVYVGDLFATDMQDTAERVLLEFSKRLRRDGLDSIFLGYAGNADFERRLERLGFILRPNLERSMVAFTKKTTDEQTSLLLDKDQWYLFDGEMDI
jgi:hypothetical protein